MSKSIRPKRIIRWTELQEKLGGKRSISTVTVWRWEKDGHFPKRIKLGPGAIGWIESEVDDWIEQRAADR